MIRNRYRDKLVKICMKICMNATKEGYSIMDIDKDCQEYQLVVSCDHQETRFQLDNESVTVSVDAMGEGFYAHHHAFGCGRTYATPERAVRGMLLRHGCSMITIF